MAGSNYAGEDRPFIAHLLELRNRLLWCVAAVVGLFLALFPFADWLFTYIAGPLKAALPEGSTIVAISPTAPFLVPMKLAFVSALFLAVPIILYQVWAFIAPGLYRHERRMVWPLLVSSTVLFYVGAAFAYFVVFPLVFHFLMSVAPEGVQPMTDMGEYLDFITAMFLAFGAAFEIPVATILLVQTGMVTRQQLREARPYVIVGAFVVGAIFTPPDVLSQFLLAVPVWLLYELGIVFSVWMVPSRSDAETDGEGT